MLSTAFINFEPSAPLPRWAVAVSLVILAVLTAYLALAEPPRPRGATAVKAASVASAASTTLLSN